MVTREAIIDLAYEQARRASLNDISFVGLAKTLGVVPGSLHYHIGTKDDLTSLVLNRFYKELNAKLDEAGSEGTWRERIERMAWVLMRCEQQHRGASEHIQTRPRYRLFQKTRDGETDYGAAFLDRAFTLFREAGFDAHETALYYHALALHCLSAAGAAATRLEPAEHESFLLEKGRSFAPGTMPGLDFALADFARTTADETFRVGLEALLDRMERSRS